MALLVLDMNDSIKKSQFLKDQIFVEKREETYSVRRRIPILWQPLKNQVIAKMRNPRKLLLFWLIRFMRFCSVLIPRRVDTIL